MISEKPVDLVELKKQFTDFLKRKNYRNTQERYKVLERIAELDKHISADELYVYMNTQGDRVSRATVYSTLDLLTRCAILVKHRFQGESAHFELAERLPDHDHLICVECGHISSSFKKNRSLKSKGVSVICLALNRLNIHCKFLLLAPIRDAANTIAHSDCASFNIEQFFKDIL
jgi:Fe2+ or Zn2+ uptake regulation protein